MKGRNLDFQKLGCSEGRIFRSSDIQELRFLEGQIVILGDTGDQHLYW